MFNFVSLSDIDEDDREDTPASRIPDRVGGYKFRKRKKMSYAESVAGSVAVADEDTERDEPPELVEVSLEEKLAQPSCSCWRCSRGDPGSTW